MQMASMLLHITQHYSSVSTILFSSFGLKSTFQVPSTVPSLREYYIESRC